LSSTAPKMSETLAVGQQLVELCRQNKPVEAIDKLYSPSIVSLEAQESPSMPQRMEGIDAIRKKNQWWEQNHQVHNAEVEGPYPHGNRFIVRFKYDVTATGGPMAGQRMNLEEAALYTVKDGKITQEEFFYHMG
jgi:ketosteroid isomerase-like protein